MFFFYIHEDLQDVNSERSAGLRSAWPKVAADHSKGSQVAWMSLAALCLSARRLETLAAVHFRSDEKAVFCRESVQEGGLRLMAS